MVERRSSSSVTRLGLERKPLTVRWFDRWPEDLGRRLSSFVRSFDDRTHKLCPFYSILPEIDSYQFHSLHRVRLEEWHHRPRRSAEVLSPLRKDLNGNEGAPDASGRADFTSWMRCR